jgi:hypothetical protein
MAPFHELGFSSFSQKRREKKQEKKSRFLNRKHTLVKRIKIGGTLTYQAMNAAMNDPMKKYVGFRSAIGCCESMTYAPVTTQCCTAQRAIQSD